MGVKKEINWDMIELCVKSGCKQVDICETYCIDEDTLRSRVKEKYGMSWSAFSAALLSEGRTLLEAASFQKALKGYWPALLWNLQIRCGQKLPENSQFLAANQSSIDQSHRIMELEHQLEELRANADQRKTE
jgi:hypothetical protein